MAWQQESLRMRVVPTCTSTFPCNFPAQCLQVQGRTQTVHCALLVPSVQNKRSTGWRYNNGKHRDTDGRRRQAGPHVGFAKAIRQRSRQKWCDFPLARNSCVPFSERIVGLVAIF